MEIDVFISYHTNSSRAVVEAVVNRLEGVGVRCWYAPRNVGANYAQSIVEAIRACRVFLLILNKESNLSAHVLNEVNCAFDRFKNHEDITLLPFRIDDCQLSDDVYYYLGRIHIMNGALPPEIQRVQELVDRVSVILGKSAGRTVTISEENSSPQGGTAAPEGKTYRLTGSMVYPDGHFVGRERELTGIHTALTGAENKMFLVGMGGIGKSEIAKMYLKRHQTDYDVILWVSFAGSLEQTIINDYAFPIQGLSRMDFPEDDDRAYFQRKLRVLKEISDRRVLLVIDNFDVTEDPDLEDFCAGRYAVLFTTRCHQEGTGLPEVEVTEMTDEAELLALFQAEYTRTLDAAALEQVKGIIRQLNGHTLSIRLVASAMQHRRIQPEKMAGMLKSGAANMAKENVKAADMIFGQLREVFRLSTLSEEEQYLLKNLVLVPLSGIEVETLFDWCGADDFDVIDELIKKSWVIHNPATDEVHLHPLVADLCQEQLAADPDCCNQFLEALLDAAERVSGSSYEWKQQVMAVADTASERLPAGHPRRRQALQARAWLCSELCLYDKCSAIYRELMETAEDLADKLRVYNELAHLKALSGRPAECRDIAREGYALVEDVPLDQLTMDQGCLYVELLHRLIESNRDLGDYETAIYYGRKVVDLGGRFHASSSSGRSGTLGWSEYHLGRALYMSGDLDESEHWMRHAVSLFQEIDDEYSQSFCFDILGQILMKQGNFTEALELNQKARDILIPRVGKEHLDIAANLVWQGNIYRAMGDEERAKGSYTQAAAIYHKLNFTRLEQQTLAILRRDTI